VEGDWRMQLHIGLSETREAPSPRHDKSV
jgi:hypothetical protein